MKVSQINLLGINNILTSRIDSDNRNKFISKKPLKLYSRGRQPYIQKLKYFSISDKSTFNNQINIIPKRRTHNTSSQKLFIKKMREKSRKRNDLNDFESTYSKSYSREQKKLRAIGDSSYLNYINSLSKKEVVFYSSEEENSSDNNTNIEEIFWIEIERKLIEIYNKNITNVNNNNPSSIVSNVDDDKVYFYLIFRINRFSKSMMIKIISKY